MRTDRPIEDTKPWYRQFWPWFIIALPGTAVVAGLITLYIASSGRDTLVKDDYYKDGLAINQDLEKAQRAATLGISAALAYDPATGDVTLTSTRVPVDVDRLNLLVVHPTLAEFDQSVSMSRAPDGRFGARLRLLGPAKWRIQLLPEAGDWRLEGRLAVPAQTQVDLR